MKISEAKEFALDVLFPKRCLWCGNVVGFSGLCACIDELNALRLPAVSLVQHLPVKDVHLLAAYAAYTYKDPVRAAILRFKFEGEPEIGQPMGTVLIDVFDACGLREYCDVVVPVPLSHVRMRQRGYNQSAILSQPLIDAFGLAYEPEVLQKVVETKAQSKLGREERQQNVKGAYVAKQGLCAGKKVLLVDDILTTGSTLNECAKTLLEAGAAECRALCLAAAEPESEAAK